jgi:ABC-type oligopeptide transport system substrate-binding subunit
VTAETFRYSIERALSPTLYSPAGAVVQDIEGEQSFRDGTAPHISGIRVNGGRLSITLTQPSPDFLQRLALPYFCPVPPGTPFRAGGAVMGRNALTGVGYIPSAGPYYIAAYNNDKYVILKRNPNYHGQRPHALDAIALREGVDAGVAVQRIQNQGWDGIVSSGHDGSVAIDPLLIPGGSLASRYGGSASQRYVAASLPSVGYIALNTSRGPLAKASIRRAVALAIDPATVAAIWQESPSRALLPPGLAAGGRASTSLAPDPVKAAKLLRGRRVRLTFAASSGCDPCLQEARAVRAELAPIGIHTTIKEFSNPGLVFNSGDPNIDMVDDGTELDYPDPASFLTLLLQQNMPDGWLSQQVSNEVDQVARFSGKARASAAVALATRLATQEVPVIPYGYQVQGEFFAPKLGCTVFPPMGYGVDLAALCLHGRS